MGSSAVAVPVTGDVGVAAFPACYMGLTLRETGGVATVVRVFDGLSATGALLDALVVPANGSVNLWYGPGGIRASTGIWFEVVSGGTVEGSVRVG